MKVVHIHDPGVYPTADVTLPSGEYLKIPVGVYCLVPDSALEVMGRINHTVHPMSFAKLAEVVEIRPRQVTAFDEPSPAIESKPKKKAKPEAEA